MANLNEAIIDPKTFFLTSQLTLDPTTLIDPPKQFETDTVTRMTVANGGVVQVYDVSDPSNPVLLGTIG